MYTKHSIQIGMSFAPDQHAIFVSCFRISIFYIKYAQHTHTYRNLALATLASFGNLVYSIM